MRVIRGYLKGKKLEGYKVSTTRPTMDRVKESLFASIQDYTEGAKVLDLFCGTGSLGIEALSMGASICYFVDNNKEILTYLKKNINNLMVSDKSKIKNLDYHDALLSFKKNNIKFDIILVDAPYKMGVMEEIISLVNGYNLLTKGGHLVLEYRFDKLNDKYGSLLLKKGKRYGDKFVSIYQNNNL